MGCVVPFHHHGSGARSHTSRRVSVRGDSNSYKIPCGYSFPLSRQTVKLSPRAPTTTTTMAGKPLPTRAVDDCPFLSISLSLLSKRSNLPFEEKLAFCCFCYCCCWLNTQVCCWCCCNCGDWLQGC